MALVRLNAHCIVELLQYASELNVTTFIPSFKLQFTHNHCTSIPSFLLFNHHHHLATTLSGEHFQLLKCNLILAAAAARKVANSSMSVTVAKTPSYCWSRTRSRHQHVAAVSPSTSKKLIYTIWVLIFLAQATLLYSITNSNHNSSQGPQPRKLLINHDLHNNSAVHTSQAYHQPMNADLGTIYDEDKRKIHTGPNPLHN